MSASRSTFLSAVALAPVALVPAAAAAAAGDARLVVFYNAPKDPAAFDKYYAGTHVAIAKQLPGLRSYTLSSGPVVTPGASSPPYHLVAELTFDSMDALNAALASPQGKAAVADIPNFATGGTEIAIFTSKSA